MGSAHARIVAAVGLGSKAPDAELTDEGGSAIFLSSFWEAQPVVLVFLSDLSAGPAGEHALALRDAAAEFDQAGGEIALVVKSKDTAITPFRLKHGISYAVLSDPTGETHAVYSASTGVASFVIDMRGVVRYAHRADNVLRAPSMFDLIDAVCGLTGEVVARPEIKPVLIASHRAAGDEAVAGAAAATEGSAFTCTKCGGSSCEAASIATSGGWISRLFNFQYRNFVAIVCTTCNYAELYRTQGSTPANVADILIGR